MIFLVIPDRNATEFLDVVPRAPLRPQGVSVDVRHSSGGEKANGFLTAMLMGVPLGTYS